MTDGTTDAGDDVLFAVRDGVARITFNRPQARNALTFAMYERLAEICRGLGDDVRVLVIAGAGGKAFAAGTDIGQFRAFRGPEDARAYEARIDGVLGSLERCPVPVIAAIDGACTGGGAAIAACCDLRLATRASRFGFPIARTLGNCLSGASLRRLSGLVGPARVKDMIFTARLLDAPEAAAAGLVTEVVETAGDLATRVEDLARQIAGNAPLTLRATKEGLRRLAAASGNVPDDDLVALCYGSEDFREGMDAFLAKRTPVWKGR